MADASDDADGSIALRRNHACEAVSCHPASTNAQPVLGAGWFVAAPLNRIVESVCERKGKAKEGPRPIAQSETRRSSDRWQRAARDGRDPTTQSHRVQRDHDRSRLCQRGGGPAVRISRSLRRCLRSGYSRCEQRSDTPRLRRPGRWRRLASRGTGSTGGAAAPDGKAANVARIVSNSRHRLARIHLSVTADSFVAAEKEAHDEVVPVLSRVAFEANTPVEVTAVLLTEAATQTRRVGATLVGTVQPAPQVVGLSTPELRPFLAAYREGLNSNSPLYQALSFYKVIEGVATFHTKRARASSSGGSARTQDPLSKCVPVDLKDLPDITDWARDVFTPHLGKTFADIKLSVSDTIRNAIAHLTPGRDIRVADYLDDIQACRGITPVLRYMAREIIVDELAALSAVPGPPRPGGTPSP